MRVEDVTPAEYASFYAGYIGRVPDVSLRSALNESAAELLEYLTHVPESRVDFSYAPGKWTIRQCLQHIIDTERIFAYRSLRIARGDKTPMPGFDQDEYVNSADVTGRSFRKMIEEFRQLRQSNLIMFNSFTDENFLEIGTMSGGPASVRAIGFIMAGHVFHHAELYRDKYGV
ncbi:MAG: putative damage-inducible protein DinB [Neolewinella sp.]|jgi:hypothetical protein